MKMLKRNLKKIRWSIGKRLVPALLSCLTACGPLPSPTGAEGDVVTVLVPAPNAQVSVLTEISGVYQMAGGQSDPFILRVRLIRLADGKYWSGSQWEFTRQNLACSYWPGGQTWNCTDTLPGTLDEGFYTLEAEISGGADTTYSRSIFRSGNPPPPVETQPFAWGYNLSGALGSGPGTNSNQPKAVTVDGVLDGRQIIDIATGSSHTLALTADGKVYSWGQNFFGQLGRGDTSDSNVPVAVDMSGVLAGKSVVAVGAGEYHSLAVASDGSVYGWGYNSRGQLGNNSTATKVTTPVAVEMGGALAGSHVIRVSGGEEFTVALTARGRLFSWGRNTDGQLGNGNSSDQRVPVAVAPVGEAIEPLFLAIDCGTRHTSAVTTDGRVYSFGWGADGRLGNGGTTSSNVPIRTGLGSAMENLDIHDVSVGRFQSLALSKEGRVFGWGSNQFSAVGNGQSSGFVASPVEIGGGLSGLQVTHLAAGYLMSCAATSDGRLFTWGNNAQGYLAGATPLGTSSTVPLVANTTGVLGGFRSVLSLDAGWDHGVMLTSASNIPRPRLALTINQVSVPPGGSHVFPANAVQSENTAVATLRNSGDAPLELEALETSGVDFSHEAVAPTNLAPGESVSFEVRFQPSVETSRFGQLSVRSNDPDLGAYEVQLAGTGLALGSLSPSFASLPITGFINTTAAQPDGKILIGGSFVQLDGVTRLNLARLQSTGALDTGFGPSVNGVVNCVVVQPDGKILLGGFFTDVGGVTRNRLARLHENGTLDTSFNPNVADGEVNTIALYPDGSMLVGGTFSKIGSSSPAFLVKLNSSGGVDGSFNAGLNSMVRCLAIQPDGLILVGGQFQTVDGQSRVRLARLEEDGFPDPDFVASVTGGNVYNVAALPDGSALVSGSFTAVQGISRNGIAKLVPNGSFTAWNLDTGYNPNVTGLVKSMAVQADGGAVIAGDITNVGVTGRSGVARIDASGALDADFNPAVSGGTVNSASLLKDGSVMLGGAFTQVDSIPRDALAMLTNDRASTAITTGSPGQFFWDVQGGSPLAGRTTLEASTDGGSSWTLVGAGVRVAAPDTQWTWFQPAAVPAVGLLRFRGYPQGGLFGGSGSIIEEVIPYNGPPNLQVSSTATGILSSFDSHDFGYARVGSVLPLTLTLTNVGGRDLVGLLDAQLTGAGAANFVLRSPSVNSLAPGDSTPLSLLFRPVSVGDHTAAFSVITNASIAPLFRLDLAGTGNLPVGTWREQQFGQADNLGIHADLGDKDLDGEDNFLEFATGRDPLQSETTPVTRTTAGPDSSTFYFFYPRNRYALSDAQFIVEWSETLTSGDWHTTGITEAVMEETGGIQQVRASVPAGSLGHRFVRLRVLRLP